MSDRWTCYARPASNGGRTCFHVNAKGILFGPQQSVCCEECGATKRTGDLRRECGDVDPAPGVVKRRKTRPLLRP
jgi:hypothetical protein